MLCVGYESFPVIPGLLCGARANKVFITNVSINVKVFGFLTVPVDVNCGVCAHEIGHLGMQQSADHESPTRRTKLITSSLWLAGSV